eukprot:3391678-Pleurochrysis_carterae.AAC.1
MERTRSTYAPHVLNLHHFKEKRRNMRAVIDASSRTRTCSRLLALANTPKKQARMPTLRRHTCASTVVVWRCAFQVRS